MRPLALAALVFALSACAVVPPSNIHQPMTVRPALQLSPVPNNGAIYQARYGTQAGYSHRPLFEDRRARAVGDVLTISINEVTAATKKSNSAANRSDSTDMGVTSLAGLPGKSLLGSSLAASSDAKFAGNGESNSNNTFSGVITVTVIEVLTNGNLLVSGEKQIGINQGSEFVRFSGVVNPATISSANTVSSTLVADARIEYRANGYIDEAQTMGWLSRFFLNFLPF